MDYKYLPEDRLATTDAKGHRVYIHPQDVSGKWTNLRKKIYWILIGIYLILPWIRINGKQLILLDLPAREFYIFGTTFYGHDGPLLIFILGGFLFLVAFVTSLLGRVWCGYACPQTVFIDSIYRVIDKLVEGSARKREKLDMAPWSLEKISKRSVKWFLFLLVSLHIVHSGLGYFVGTHELLEISLHRPSEHWGLFLTMLVSTAIILLDFGWFREQFCIIACPYGRFQSIAMDENSLIVAYDEKRGEPRKRTEGVDPKDNGDCVNCDRCVKVCPTGIDIRNGLQMECIACTMCIDACDEIMRKVNKPEGLIRYTTEYQLQGQKAKISPRVYIYGIMFVGIMIGLVTTLSIRGGLKAQLMRAGKVPYQEIARVNQDKLIVNHYSLRLRYYEDTKLLIRLIPEDPTLIDKIKIIVPEYPIEIVDQNLEVSVFFQFDHSLLTAGQKSFVLNYVDQNNKVHKQVNVTLVGPLK